MPYGKMVDLGIPLILGYGPIKGRAAGLSRLMTAAWMFPLALINGKLGRAFACRVPGLMSFQKVMIFCRLMARRGVDFIAKAAFGSSTICSLRLPLDTEALFKKALELGFP
jgi:hypothetical protein